MRTALRRQKFTIVFFFCMIQYCLNATVYPINVTFSGSQETPSNASAGTGTLTGTYDDATKTLMYTINFSGLSANVTAAHLHAPAPPGIAAGVMIPAAGFPTGVTSGTFNGSHVLTQGQEDTLKLGLWYFNIHTSAFPGGEIRAQIFLQNSSFVVPDIVCKNDTTVDAEAGKCSASVEFAVTASAGTPAPAFYYRIGNTAITSPHDFPVGTTTVIATALNSAGYDSCSFKVTVKDVEPPTITCPADITQDNDPGECGAIVDFSVDTTDNCSGVTVSYSQDPGTMFPVGTTTVTATATDAAGNTASCTFSVTVNDVEPPVVTCPADITQDNDPGECGAIVDFIAEATDNCPNVTISYSQDPGTFFPVGTTTVTVTATDGSNNTSSCTFDVTVNDVEPPVIEDIEVHPPILWPPNHKMKNVTVDYTSRDNCPGPISCELTVTSNEPENGTGDGDTGPDWEITDDHHLKLRAERSGTGTGRVYTITISCTDQYNNTGSETVDILVPKSMSLAEIRRLVFQYLNPGRGHGNGNGNHREGEFSTGADSKNVVVMNEWDPEKSTIIRAYPNPSRNYFTLNILTGNTEDKISVRMFDVSGRLVEANTSITGSQSIQVGANLRPGLYIAEISQGSDVKHLKLLKQ